MSTLDERLVAFAQAIADRFDSQQASLESIGATVKTFPAVADCTGVGLGTDNAPALNAAISALGLHGEIHLPPGHIRIGSPIKQTTGIKLVGAGYSENPGNINGTSYPLPLNYQGTVLVFDQNVPGIQLIDFTDQLANATSFQYQGSRFAVLEDLMFYGGGGTNISAHGIDVRTTVRVRNVRAQNFAGNGWNIAGYSTGANPYGTPNQSSFLNAISRNNGCHGFYVAGTDANAMLFAACDGSINGGVGFLEKSLIGNTYIGCHAATNNQSFGASTAARTQVIADWAGLSDSTAGSYVTSNGGGAENLYLGCYTEGGAGYKGEITAPSLVIGGLLSEVGARTAAWTAEVWQGSSGGLTVGKTVIREQAAGAISTPAAGFQAIFIDTADHKLKRKDSTGTVTVIA